MIFFGLYLLIGFLIASLIMWALELVIHNNQSMEENATLDYEQFLSHILLSILDALYPDKKITNEVSLYLPIFIICGFIWPVLILILTILTIKISYKILTK